MANDVFANGREISCKKASGKSICAFPDVCWTPPEKVPPTPTGVPIPYPNTGVARDTKNGTKKVKITGKEVMLKDQSYFKKSTGDEPGCAQLKGIVTRQNRGKVYFQTWSMDVKFEGKNVTRHMDLMTHNHNSKPGNTGPWAYTDTRTENKACKNEKKRVQRKCKPTKNKGNKRVPDNSPGAWKKQFCTGLQVKPPNKDAFDPKRIEQELDNMLNVQKQLEQGVQRAKDALVDKIETWALKKGGKMLAKGALKSVLGPVGWVWTAYDVYQTGVELNDLKSMVSDLDNYLKDLKEVPKKLQQLKNQQLTPKVMADAQALIAKASPCLRARKCMLVPYKKKYQSSKPGDRNSGCCSGQTGHHLIPKSAFNEQNCPGYDEDKAPTVCVEGTSHSRGGSHEAIHTRLERKIESSADSNGEMSYVKARTNAIKSLNEIGYRNCSSQCLAAQLDNYHKKACGNLNGNVKAQSAKSSKQYVGDDSYGED